MSDIVIVGASTGPGRLLFEKLGNEGRNVVGIARHSRAPIQSENARFIELDASDVARLNSAIPADATLIHCSRPELLTNYLATRPKLNRLIALGSTRIYTQFPDDKYHRLRAMAEAIWASELNATLLHPTMIYGAPGLDNIERVVRIAQLSPMIPLPAGGKSLIQPVHAADVVAAIEACITRDASLGKTITVPGATALSYQQFISLCIETSGSRCRVASLPYPILTLAAALTKFLPGVPTVTTDEVRRLLEDKNFDTSDMTRLLGVQPRSFEDGIREMAFASKTIA